MRKFEEEYLRKCNFERLPKELGITPEIIKGSIVHA